MKTWLHRISHHADISYPLLEQGWLSIGWSGFGTSEYMAGIRKGGWSFLDSMFGEDRPRNRYSLGRFLIDMKKADRVVVPSWGTFSVYEIVGEEALPMSDYPCRDLFAWDREPVVKDDSGRLRKGLDYLIDLGFLRAVKPIATNMARSSYADAALTSRMKIRTTNADISDLGASVEKAIAGFRESRPVTIESQIMTTCKTELLKLIQGELNPDKLERLVKWYFDKAGASDVYIPAKNERDKLGDADVVATFEQLKTIFYVQVKHHEGQTSDWAVRQIREYRDNRQEKDDGYSQVAWVVSTCKSFSAACKAEASEANVTLLNGEELVQMILATGLDRLDTALS